MSFGIGGHDRAAVRHWRCNRDWRRNRRPGPRRSPGTAASSKNCSRRGRHRNRIPRCRMGIPAPRRAADPKSSRHSTVSAPKTPFAWRPPFPASHFSRSRTDRTGWSHSIHFAREVRSGISGRGAISKTGRRTVRCGGYDRRADRARRDCNRDFPHNRETAPKRWPDIAHSL
jgi:hypothetical protein